LLAAELPESEVVVWDDPEVAWDDFDLVVVRSTWDYTQQRDAFVAWADSVGERLLNPPEVIRWNSDKRYLADLAAAGLPIVPTTFVVPGADVAVPDGPCVIKPAVSAGSQNTASHPNAESAAAHARRLLDEGRVVMVQPYIADVDDHGETALLYFDGAYDHAIRKGAMLRQGPAAVEGLFAPEDIEPREPRPAEREVADAVIAEVERRFGRLLYARVDLVGDDPKVLELELTEPSLFFAQSPGSAQRFATAIRARLPH
jgi:glutathione synthase/RimK-type ligase-like ATP-grasp enzyme